MAIKVCKKCEKKIVKQITKEGLCPKCGDRKLIYRPWLRDFFCGNCGQEYNLFVRMHLIYKNIRVAHN